MHTASLSRTFENSVSQRKAWQVSMKKNVLSTRIHLVWEFRWANINKKNNIFGASEAMEPDTFLPIKVKKFINPHLFFFKLDLSTVSENKLQKHIDSHPQTKEFSSRHAIHEPKLHELVLAFVMPSGKWVRGMRRIKKKAKSFVLIFYFLGFFHYSSSWFGAATIRRWSKICALVAGLWVTLKWKLN